MNDVNKLNGIITSLEDQARKVSEFSGLLAAVNDARKEIESSKSILEAASAESRHFLKDSRSQFDSLERRLLTLEKKLEQIAAAQSRTSDQLMSLDILTPQVFSETSKISERLLLERLDKLEVGIDAIKTSQLHQNKKVIRLWLFSTVMLVVVLGRVLNFV